MRYWGRPVVAAAITFSLLALMPSPVVARADLPVDPMLHTTSNGLSYYLDEAATAPVHAERIGSPATPPSTYPLANTFKLHSKSGSKHTIFLDFNGNTVMVDSWSTMLGPNAVTAGNYPGFNLTGQATTYTDYELKFIQQIYRQVAELYAPFDVDVTTQDPGAAAINRANPSDDTYGVQVAFTSGTKASSLACDGCSGIAPIGSFNDVEAFPGENQPAWVFMKNAYPSTSYLNSSILSSDSAAHEIGHTFGLSHDGLTTVVGDNYYGGQGSWFPIMGTHPGDRAIGQWSKGEYTNANNSQDDLAIIASGGAPLRSDDYGTAPGAPSNLGKQTSYRVSGTIGSDADNDYFTFNRGCSGPMTIKATGNGFGTPLDLKLTVLNSAGATVATNDPASSQMQVSSDPWWRATGMDAAASLTKAANASYAVKVEGVGRGSAATNGYSGYGSIGKYTLTISSCTASTTPVKKPSAPVIGTASSGTSGTPVNATARWSAPKSNGGAAITKYHLQAVKLSATGEVLVVYTYSNLSPGQRSLTATLPAGRYKFRLLAVNRVGSSGYSAYSKIVLSR